MALGSMPCRICSRPINAALPHIYDECPTNCPFDTGVWEWTPEEDTPNPEPVAESAVAPEAEPAQGWGA